MCGIVSILSREEPLTETPLRRALAALRHRGPDGEGLWLSPDRRVALGHTRLGIIDPLGGVQPIASEDGQLQIVVNGEFYDFERIRRDLQRDGHRFRTGSDSEIALHLYEDLGPDCLQHLRGEFAFVVWDGRQRHLFAARDRFGIKPLCFAATPGRLAIASEAKALFAAGVRPAWDRDAFFQAASHQYLPPDRTLFAGVAQLRPGHYLIADDTRVETHRYWDLDYARLGDHLPEQDEADHIRELGDRLDEAVRLRLRADVPVCCHLSGGLDSSAVLALATRAAGTPPPCFTVSFAEGDYDELDIARESAARLDAALHVVRVDQGDLVAHLADAVYFSEGLAINGHLAAKYLLSRAIQAAGYKVALTGEGSDELLAGYPHLRRDLFLSSGSTVADPAIALATLHATNAVIAGIQLAEGPSLPLGAVERPLGFVPSFLEAKGALGLRMRPLLSADFLAEFRDRDPFHVLLDAFDLPGQLAGRHRVDQSSYLWTRLSLANYILRTLGDGTEMAHSVEGRLPFLDHHLFEFARRLPIGLKIRGDVEKYILREAVRPLISDRVYRRQKHPFTAPPLGRFPVDSFGEMISDLFAGQGLALLPFFDRAEVLRLVSDLPRMESRERAATDPVLMIALTAALLHQRFQL
jgi:asparagine synthase (glutamine-hydrolysing)